MYFKRESAGKSGKFELFIAYWRTFAGVRKPGARSQQSGACRRATPPCRRSHSRRHKQLGTPRKVMHAISPSGWRRQLPRKSVRQS